MSNVQTSKFFAALGTAIPETELAVKEGMTYISAAVATKLAGRPNIQFVDFGDKPFLECFGGALVAVDLVIPDTEQVQRTWLQVMDQDNNALSISSTTLTDINNSRQRCLAKALASVYGYGMSLYLGCNGDGTKAVNMLGVKPDADLAEATPVVSMLRENGAAFIEWGVGLSACRITDPAFSWSVIEWNGKPFREVLGGAMVDVETVYKGKHLVLSLPIMDAAFNALAIKKVTVNDWNKAVMRALTKCIAFNSGYGLSVYGSEFGVAGVQSKGAKPGKTASTASKGTKKVTEQSADTAQATATNTQEPKTASSTDASGVAQQPAKEAEQPVKEAEQPAKEAEQPAKEAEQPVKEAEQPTQEAEQPAKEAEQPVKEAEQPTQEAEQPVKEAEQPNQEADEGQSIPNTNWPKASADALTRFKAVMQSRRDKAGVAGLITLFEALELSTKFEDSDKPGCYVQLLSAAAAVVDGPDVELLLAAIKQYNAMQYLDDATHELVAARITASTLHHMCDRSDAALASAPGLLLDAGIGFDLQDIMRLAAAGKVTKETMDLLKTVLESAAA